MTLSAINFINGDNTIFEFNWKRQNEWFGMRQRVFIYQGSKSIMFKVRKLENNTICILFSNLELKAREFARKTENDCF